MANYAEVTAQQYGSTVHTLAQQKHSKLRNAVRLETMSGEKRFFDRVKPTSMVPLNTRYGDTPLIETEFDRRALHAREFGWGDLSDWKDELDIFLDPKSDIVKAGAMAMARGLDDEIIEKGFMGPAYEGKDGLTVVPFPASQQMAITYGGNGNTGLTMAKLTEVINRFELADIDTSDPENQVYMAVTQRQIHDLVSSVDLGNKDYDLLRALYTGATDTFLGIKFIRINRLPVTQLQTGRSRLCCAWCKSGIILAESKALEVSIDPRVDKQKNWQVFMRTSIGCTRIEDVKVQQVFCYEA